MFGSFLRMHFAQNSRILFDRSHSHLFESAVGSIISFFKTFFSAQPLNFPHFLSRKLCHPSLKENPDFPKALNIILLVRSSFLTRHGHSKSV
jgi:hypothetical protein